MHGAIPPAFPALALLLAAAAGGAEPLPAGTLRVELSGLKPGGTLRMGIYDSAEAYAGGESFTGANVAVEGETVSVTFEELAPGDYAIRLYHDRNDNGELDTNPFGLPTEPYAFSNNARGNFGPATWEQARFTLGAEAGALQSLSLE